MSIKHGYNHWAATYDSDLNLTRDLDGQALRELIGSRRYASVLELGCGTGKNSIALAAQADQLLALDFAPAMIQRARARVSAAHVRFGLADLTGPWPCASASADLITANLLLEHIAALAPVFDQAARVLRPGGTLLVCELHPFRQYRGAQARFASGLIPAFVHHCSDFTNAATAAGLALHELREWWDAADAGQPPRLLSLRFSRPR